MQVQYSSFYIRGMRRNSPGSNSDLPPPASILSCSLGDLVNEESVLVGALGTPPDELTPSAAESDLLSPPISLSSMNVDAARLRFGEDCRLEPDKRSSWSVDPKVLLVAAVGLCVETGGGCGVPAPSTRVRAPSPVL